ncbi:MAG: hypothetical protein ACRD2L_03440 [Terriglobia bacterium]
MVAIALLVVSYLFLAYLVIPAGLFRFSVGSLALKEFHKDRFAEVSFAVSVCFLPLGVATLLAWLVSVSNAWPPSVRILWEPTGRWDAYKTLLELASKENIPAWADFWSVATDVAVRQLEFLLLYWFVASFAGQRYAHFVRNRTFYKRWPRFQRLLLKGLSEWNILEPRFHSELRDPVVLVDVRTDEDNLVKGRLQHHFLGRDGELSGLLVRDAVRRRRRGAEGGHGPDSWRYVPGRHLYIPFSSVADMNVRYMTEKEYMRIPTIRNAMEAYIADLLKAQGIDVRVKTVDWPENEKGRSDFSERP